MFSSWVEGEARGKQETYLNLAVPEVGCGSTWSGRGEQAGAGVQNGSMGIGWGVAACHVSHRV